MPSLDPILRVGWQPSSVPGRVIEFDDNLRERIVSFEYTEKANGGAEGKLSLDNHDLALFDHEAVKAEGRLFVQWGYAWSMYPTQEFTIEKVKGFRELAVEGSLSSARRLLGVQRTRTFENSTEFEVAEEVAQSIGFTSAQSRNIEAGDIEVQRRGITQAGETDMAFLQRLGNQIGATVYIAGGIFHFHERRLGQVPQKTFTFFNDTQGTIIGEPELEQNIQGRPGQVRRRGHSNRERGAVDGEASNRTDTQRPMLGDEMSISDPSHYDWETISADLGIDQEELPTQSTPTTSGEAQSDVAATTAESDNEARSRARQGFRRSERESVKLSLTVVGDPEVRADHTVRVEGIGAKYSGNYYVEEATHTVDGSGYSTKLKMNRNGTSRTGTGRSRNRPSAQADTAFSSDYGYSIDAQGNFHLEGPPENEVTEYRETDRDGSERTRYQPRTGELPQSRQPDPWEEG